MDVYDKFKYNPTEYNLSRSEAMRNFYVIDQNGKRHKNTNALFLLYWHSSKLLHAFCLFVYILGAYFVL